MSLKWPVMAVLATIGLAFLSIGLRQPCFAEAVPPEVVTGTGCYSDLAVMWSDRGIGHHVFPYLQTLPPTGRGPITVEYPVLAGVLLWLLSLPVDTYQEFVWLATSVMGACAVAITTILYRTVGHLTWLWAAAPALVLYLSYNLDAAPALCTVAALAMLTGRNASTVGRGRIVGAAALLAVGAGLKLYPLLFIGPLCLWLLRGDPGNDQTLLTARVKRSSLALLVGFGGFIAINLPFALANLDGWLEPFRFQAARGIDPSTMSIWYYIGSAVPAVPAAALMTLATVSTAVGLACILAASWWMTRDTRPFPLVGSSVAVLATYLVLNKVFSPQYIIWLLPLVLVLGVHAGWALAYLLIDAVLYWSWYLSGFAYLVEQEVVAEFWRDVKLSATIARLVLVVTIGLLALASARLGSPAVRWLGVGRPLAGRATTP